MKKLCLTVAMVSCFSAYAQKNNTLLNQTFWKEKPNLAQVKAEIEKGNSPSEKNSIAMDPVVMAINAEVSRDVIGYLLAQKGNEVSKLTHDGRIYLHWAAMRGNAELVAALIEMGSKVSFEDSYGITPLLFAAGGGQQNTAVYELLIKAGANLKKEVNSVGANALLLAAANDKDLKLTDYFISKGLDLNSKDADGNNIFSYAAKSGKVEPLKALYAKGVKPTNLAFLTAASAGGRRGSGSVNMDTTDGLAVYQYLESIGLKPTALNKEGRNVIHLLVGKPGQINAIKYFISKGVKATLADKEGNTPFMIAAYLNRDLTLLEFLANQTEDINQTNDQGASALALAIKNNSAEAVNFLITKGAKLHLSDKKGNNMGAYLLQTYRPQNAKIFEEKTALLKEKGFDFSKLQGDGNTLYHLAVIKNDLVLLKNIANLKIDVNIKNKEGYTALQKAAMVAKDDRILKYLLSIGADKLAKTDFEETAFDLALENEELSKKQISITFLK